MSTVSGSGSSTCPHCNHYWDMHTPRCTQCGCYRSLPNQPPKPPTARELAVERVRAAIYAELDRQHDDEDIDGAGYWDDDWGRLDGEPNWSKVAEAALDAAQEGV